MLPTPPLASLLGRVAASAAAAVTAPLQRGSCRNARDAVASDRVIARARLDALGDAPQPAFEAVEALATTRTHLGA